MRVGILGAGQLAKMLAIAAYPMNIDVLVYDPVADACSKKIAPFVTAAYDDFAALEKFVNAVDVITFETENIPLKTAKYAANLKLFKPSLQSLEICQDRLLEKQFCQSLQIPTANFCKIDSLAELQQAFAISNAKKILKTRRQGYDGKGQFSINSSTDIAQINIDFLDQPCILEERISFDLELSQIAVRGWDGQIKFYPLTLNHHEAGILRTSQAPWQDAQLTPLAQEITRKILEKLGYIGVIGVELFKKDQQLLVNEIAPRVHNSGHWTIEGAVTSQFANHLRAICDLPLGATDVLADTRMVNCIGAMPDIIKVLQDPYAFYHAYGKKPKSKRKVGHITYLKNK